MKTQSNWFILWPIAVIVAVVILVSAIQMACGPVHYAEHSRKECERCEDDSDCKEGMTCKVFSGKVNGSAMLLQFCAYSYTYECEP